MIRNLPTLVVIAAILLAAGCTHRQTAQSPTSQNRATTASDQEGTSPSGQDIFDQNCARCHGQNGEKIAGWKAKVQKMTEEQVETQVRNGGGGMPAFKDRLSGGEITAVAKYAKRLAAK